MLMEHPNSFEILL